MIIDNSQLFFGTYPISITETPRGYLYGSLCTLHLTVTSFGATLDMGDWLDLSQQGLSPCKKVANFLAY